MNVIKIVGAMLALILSILAAPLRSEVVIQSPENSASLEQRWKWAQDQKNSRKLQNVWIAYSIEQLMGEREFIGSFYSSRKKFPTLRELLTGKKEVLTQKNAEEVVRQKARDALSDLEKKESQQKVMKEVAFLMGFKNSEMDRINISMVDLQVDLQGRPLVWMGVAENSTESIQFLKTLFPKSKGANQQEDVIAAIGVHKDPVNVIAALSPILKGGQPDDIRGHAGFWIANQDDPQALKLLVNHMKTETSENVIEESLVGISEMTIPGSTDALIEWTSPSYNGTLREQAIFWLGQKTPKALDTLEQIAMQDKDPDIREKAVFSLSELENEGKTAALIRIGRNHPDTDTRKEAIFWLSQNYSKQAAGTLKEFAENDRDYEVQKQAIFALSELDNGEGVDQLIQLAKKHENPKIRKEAIFWLGECDDPRAHAALLDIIESKQ